MSVLDWRQRGEDCIESIAKDGTRYRIDKIPDGYDWKASYANPGKQFLHLTIGGLTHCQGFCEDYQKYKEKSITEKDFNPVISLAAAELIQPLPTISRRDYFAAMAMQGILANQVHADLPSVDIAHTALLCADALIEALGEGE